MRKSCPAPQAIVKWYFSESAQVLCFLTRLSFNFLMGLAIRTLFHHPINSSFRAKHASDANTSNGSVSLHNEWLVL